MISASLRVLSFLIIFAAFDNPLLRAEDEFQADRAPGSISPVHEEMVGNQIRALHRRLWNDPSKPIVSSESFSVMGWNEDAKALAAKVAKQVRTKKGLENLQFVNRRVKAPFHGVILVAVGKIENVSQEQQLEKEVPEAVQFLALPSNKGFILVFTWTEPDRKQVGALIKKYGFRVIESISERELEFVKDEKGRQMVGLDDLKWQSLIYERFVRGGMNPVNAWPAVEEAVQNFRKSQDSKILIIGKK